MSLIPKIGVQNNTNIVAGWKMNNFWFSFRNIPSVTENRWKSWKTRKALDFLKFGFQNLPKDEMTMSFADYCSLTSLNRENMLDWKFPSVTFWVVLGGFPSVTHVTEGYSFRNKFFGLPYFSHLMTILYENLLRAFKLSYLSIVQYIFYIHPL